MVDPCGKDVCRYAVLALAFEVLAAARGSHDLVISTCKGPMSLE